MAASNIQALAFSLFESLLFLSWSLFRSSYVLPSERTWQPTTASRSDHHRSHFSSPERKQLSREVHCREAPETYLCLIVVVVLNRDEMTGTRSEPRRSPPPTNTGHRYAPPRSPFHRSWSMLSESHRCYGVDVSYPLVTCSTWSIW